MDTLAPTYTHTHTHTHTHLVHHGGFTWAGAMVSWRRFVHMGVIIALLVAHLQGLRTVN